MVRHGGVAQLAEQRTHKPRVTGSNPVTAISHKQTGFKGRAPVALGAAATASVAAECRPGWRSAFARLPRWQALHEPQSMSLAAWRAPILRLAPLAQDRGERGRRPSRTTNPVTAMMFAVVLAWPPLALRAEAAAPKLSPQAQEAVALLDSDDAYERKMGFLRLEALREPGTADIIRRYLDHKSSDMRADSLRALAAIEGPNAIPEIRQRLERDKRARVRWSALLALEPFAKSHPELLPIFIGAMDDYRTEVRMAAIDIVSRIKDPAAREAIQLHYRKELHPDVRRVLKMALERMGDGS